MFAGESELPDVPVRLDRTKCYQFMHWSFLGRESSGSPPSTGFAACGNVAAADAGLENDTVT